MRPYNHGEFTFCGMLDVPITPNMKIEIKFGDKTYLCEATHMESKNESCGLGTFVMTNTTVKFAGMLEVKNAD